MKHNDFNLFPSGNNLLLLLLMFFSVNNFAQIHVSENTIFIVKEKTNIYSGGKKIDSFSIAVSKETQAKKSKKISTNKKKRAKPQQPPMVYKDTKSGNRAGVLSFNSTQKDSSTLFHSSKATKVALVNNNSNGSKLFYQNRIQNTNNYSFLQRNENSISNSSNDFQILRQGYLKKHIARPPPQI